jgi:hypothetical protein
LTELVAVAGVALILGYLGWILPTVGGSLLLPTIIVVGVGVALAATGALIARKFRRPTGRIKVFVVGAAIATTLAGIWAFQFSLPVALWSSNATTEAQAALSALGHSATDRNGVAPNAPCSTHDTGSLGPLEAPYREYATWTPEGHFVTFTGTHSQGVGYTNVGATTFPDQCARHLFGDWWMFVGSNNPSEPGQCPIGYRFQGGG